MDDTKQQLKDALNKGISIASNPDIPAGEAARQVLGAAKAEFDEASSYSQRRKQRKAEQKTKLICCLRPKASMPAQAAK